MKKIWVGEKDISSNNETGVTTKIFYRFQNKILEIWENCFLTILIFFIRKFIGVVVASFESSCNFNPLKIVMDSKIRVQNFSSSNFRQLLEIFSFLSWFQTIETNKIGARKS